MIEGRLEPGEEEAGEMERPISYVYSSPSWDSARNK